MSRIRPNDTDPPDRFHRVSRVTTSFDGALIHWDLYPSPGAPAVVILPGFWRTRRHASILKLAEEIAGNGYQVAAVDLRGHGESEGTFGFNFQEYRDVLAVLDDLRAAVSPPSLALLGLSYGGAVAISAAARAQVAPDALFLLSPVASFASIAPRINPFTIHRHVVASQAFHKPKFEMRVFSSPRIEAIDDIPGVLAPAAFAHVVDDWLVHHSHSERLAEAHRGEHQLHLIDIPGGYHADRVFSIIPGRIEKLMVEFLNQRLRR
ncbi:MAG: lysophospholipase [Acidobacteria bacterium]|nr:lysophospholipase [Acidobacteriota bacterium]